MMVDLVSLNRHNQRPPKPCMRFSSIGHSYVEAVIPPLTRIHVACSLSDYEVPSRRRSESLHPLWLGIIIQTPHHRGGCAASFGMECATHTRGHRASMVAAPLWTALARVPIVSLAMAPTCRIRSPAKVFRSTRNSDWMCGIGSSFVSRLPT